MDIVKQKFLQEFRITPIVSDLMDIIEEIDMTGDVLYNYMIDQFTNDFTYGELYDLFKNEVSKEELKELLINMGHDYVDLDSLDDEEQYKYY